MDKDPDPETRLKLADMLREGSGCEKDSHAAYNHCRIAADEGIMDAQFKIGEMYEKGEI